MIDRRRIERMGEVNLDIEAAESLSRDISESTCFVFAVREANKGKLVSAELELLPKHLEMHGSNLC
jgi:hypothetical protein